MKTLLFLLTNYCFCLLTAYCLTGCTYNISMAHTEGVATDTIDDTATNTPSTTVSPTVSIPATAL